MVCVSLAPDLRLAEAFLRLKCCSRIDGRPGPSKRVFGDGSVKFAIHQQIDEDCSSDLTLDTLQHFFAW